MDPITKRRYNTTYKLRNAGYVINTHRQEIHVYFRQVSGLIGNPHVITMVKEYSYKLVENRQLELSL